MRGNITRKCDCPRVPVEGKKLGKKKCRPDCKAPYYVVIDIGPDPETGKRRQKWHAAGPKKRDAERILTELLHSLAVAAYVPPTKQTVSQFLDEWLPAIRLTVKPATYDSYSRNVRLHLKPGLGTLPLTALDGSRLNAFYANKLDPPLDAAGKGPKALSPRTVAYLAVILHRAMRDAVKWGRIVANPCERADPPRARPSDRPTMRTWTAAEVRTFLEGTVNDRLAAYWRIMATCGTRRGEPLGLTWADLNLDAETPTMRVHRALVIIDARRTGEPGYGWSTPKTNAGKRNVALGPVTVDVLKAHRKRQLEERMLIGAGYKAEDDLVFAMPDGSPIHPKTISYMFGRAILEHKLPKIRLHDLRHTHATLALEAGIHPRVVQERLGHANVSITLDTYSHVNPAMQADAAEKVAALFLGGDR